PEDLALDVLYEDESILVLNKAAGMVVHPGAGNPSGTVANAIRHRVPNAVIGGEERPGIVHRLDKDTSGVMVIALEEQAMRVLATSFKEREVKKEYLAFCLGRPRRDRFELVTGHRRDDNDRRRFTTRLAPPGAQDVSGNRRAHSSFEVLYSRAGVSQLRVELHTGRTHQIRAHLADFGFPLIEDALYGGGQAHRRVGPGPVRRAVERLGRQGLHAHKLSFAHPRSGALLHFEATLPTDLAAVADALVTEDD
ncbi:MAG: RluA family pseudouridine synthase, partial [Myxococcota bacterium]